MKQNWLIQNRKWLIPVGFLGSITLVIGFVGAIFLFVMSIIKSSVVYQDAIIETKQNQEVIEKLGENIKEGYFVTGKIELNDNSGYANLVIPVSGEKGEGNILVIATKKGEKWHYEQLEIDIAGEKINLID
jgi:hypothetical protein